ncbi:MAG: DUF3570 domain-containing protein, partial [Thiohalomonadales bacterium]|nr:DUF3570 domain-containing protein [Thiohalomonadales bacterium]
MQLKKPKSIRNALAVATCSMLSGVSHHAAAESTPWEIDSALLYYGESDPYNSRITVVEPVIRARKEIATDEYLTFRLVLDSLTGASANGAIPQATPQTFTSPSGDGTYTTAANQTPLDPTFHDTRGAINAEWELPLSRLTKGIFSANFSQEYDYTSMGLAATLSRDFNNRNTTLAGGLSYNADTVRPVGDAPEGLTPMPTTTTVQKATIGSDLSKNVADLLLGVTQVINRNTLMQLNFTYGMDDGYLTDPYKILSVVDNSGTLVGPDPYLYEKRPDSRTRQALYWKTVHQFNEDVIYFSYRYYWDDWGIASHTLDLKYRSELGGGHYLEPHLRYYTQSKADFYHYAVLDGSTPDYVSADYRLADLD